MSEHLTIGSQQPPLVDGKLRLYSMEYCPFAQRVRLVLKVKKIPHDIVNINLTNKPEWFLKIHPEGKVPAIDTGSKIVIESLVVCDFLEETYPEIPLYPKDPEAKKHAQELIKKMDPLIGTFYKCILDQGKTPLEEWTKEFAPKLQDFESELATKKTEYFGGDKPGMVDYMLWPWGERAGVLMLAFGRKLPFGPDQQFPLLRNWGKAMREDPASDATYNGPEMYWKIIDKSVKKQPIDYDNL